MFQPLNPPAAGATAEQVAASNQASIEAFQLAMWVCAGLLVVGALVSWYGLREPRRGAGHGSATSDRRRPPDAHRTARRRLAVTAPMTRDWDARTYDRVAAPMTRWGSVVLDRLPLDGRRARARRRAAAADGSPRCWPSACRAGRVVALDGSAAMVEATRERLARFGDRVEYVVADLGAPLPIEGQVDAILSTATFHWVPDHDALFRNLAAVTRPGGLARRPMRRGRQHRVGPARPGDDRRRLARQRPLRDADGDRPPARRRRATSTSNAG